VVGRFTPIVSGPTESLMIYIWGSLGLLIAYVGCALLAIHLIPDLAAFEDVDLTCRAAGLDLESCRGAAQSVGWLSLASLIAVCFVAYALDRTWRSQPSRRYPLDATMPQALLLAFLLALAVVVILHNLERVRLVDPVDVRIPPHESTFISLENLAWPVLLQLFLWTRICALKATIIAFLSAVIALSPFRAVLFAALYFGAAIPLVSWLCARPPQARGSPRLALAGLALTIAALALGIVYQTQTRRLQAVDAGADLSLHPAGLIDALASRTMTPLFQAELAARMVAAQPSGVPTFADTVASKFSRDDVLNLNRWLYGTLYQANTEGQTTSMLFGEAVANSSQWPGYWLFSAPLLLILVYIVLRNMLDIQVLVAVALWRGAMGGLFDVLPALVLQLAFCLMIGWVFGAHRRWR
jgi:hypothetical protein